jgi:ribose 1,5-bisphosphokinase
MTQSGTAVDVSAAEADFQGGCFIAVVGPSGAGKDTLLRGVQERLSDHHSFVFARRIITRPTDSTEDHDSVTEQEFGQLQSRGGFLLSWTANGLSYGIPAGLRRNLQEGSTIIANVSRAILPEVRQRFHRHLVIHVTATAEVLAARLGARGREDFTSQQARLARALLHDANVCADVVIDNSADLYSSLMAFEQVLRRLACTARSES